MVAVQSVRWCYVTSGVVYGCVTNVWEPVWTGRGLCQAPESQCSCVAVGACGLHVTTACFAPPWQIHGGMQLSRHSHSMYVQAQAALVLEEGMGHLLWDQKTIVACRMAGVRPNLGCELRHCASFKASMNVHACVWGVLFPMRLIGGPLFTGCAAYLPRCCERWQCMCLRPII